MLLERIGDGAFVTANKLHFCYTNWEFAYELFANLTYQQGQKSKLKFKTQKLTQKSKSKSKKTKVESQKLRVED